jgi:hypothetical protein
MSDPVNILCLKWGTRYPAHYVNRLYHSVKRNLTIPFLFHCCTEDPSGLDADIRIIPFPPDPDLPGRGWPDILVKLVLTADGFGGLRGPTLFLDVDIIITGNMDCFFQYRPGENCIIHNWVSPRKLLFRKKPHVGNSSVFRFEAGNSGYIYETFLREKARAADFKIFNTEQAFLTYAMKEVNWWPADWVRSFKFHCRKTFPLNHVVAPSLPQDCRILVFHGKPDPDEAIVGFTGKRPNHKTLPAPWILDYWK